MVDPMTEPEYTTERLFLNIIAADTVSPFKLHGISLRETLGMPKRPPRWRRVLNRLLGRKEPVPVATKRVVMGPRRLTSRPL